MKKIAIFTTVVATAVLFASPSMADTTATENATAYATIVAPLNIESVSGEDLNFGKIVSPDAQITVTVTPAGGISSTGAANQLLGGHKAAQFSVSGAANQNVKVTLPASFTIDDGGSNSMTVSTPTSDIADLNAFPLGSTGSATFHMGATLTVGAGQEEGEYSGPYTVTVSY